MLPKQINNYYILLFYSEFVSSKENMFSLKLICQKDRQKMSTARSS